MEPSYASGTSSTPLLGDTIGDNLDRTIERFADREALVSVHQDLRYTYAQFGEAVDRARARVHRRRDRARRPRRDLEPELRRVGARPVRDGQGRDHPGQHQPGLPDVGARVRAAPVGLPDAGRRDRVQDLRLRADGRRRARQPRRARAGRVHRARLGGVHRRRRARVAPRSCAERQAATQFDDPINIQYTSGTTGFPKGATLSHHNILNNGYFVGARLPLHARRTGSASRCPTTTASAWSWATSRAPSHGACMVIPAAAFDPVATLQAVQDERCTSLYGVPTMFIAELEHPEFGEFDLSSLRTGIMAGSPCPIETMRRVVSEMHMEEVTICYGMTETSPVSTQTGADDPLEKRVGTVGPRAPARRGQDRRPRERRDRRPRRARRAVHARLQRDARLLGGAREDRRRDRPRALDAHRRPRADGRRGLRQDRRAASRTWSSAAARTSTRARSRSS